MKKLKSYAMLAALIVFAAWSGTLLAEKEEPTITLEGSEAEAFQALMESAGVKPETSATAEKRAAECVWLKLDRYSYKCCAIPGTIRCFGPYAR